MARLYCAGSNHRTASIVERSTSRERCVQLSSNSEACVFPWLSSFFESVACMSCGLGADGAPAATTGGHCERIDGNPRAVLRGSFAHRTGHWWLALRALLGRLMKQAHVLVRTTPAARLCCSWVLTATSTYFTFQRKLQETCTAKCIIVAPRTIKRTRSSASRTPERTPSWRLLCSCPCARPMRPTWPLLHQHSGSDSSGCELSVRKSTQLQGLNHGRSNAPGHRLRPRPQARTRRLTHCPRSQRCPGGPCCSRQWWPA